jgi:hypothetical protein
MKQLLAAGLVLALGFGSAAAQDEKPTPVPPLLRAHAHNDYHHPRPLLDALDHGFTSVEADVFLVDGKLLIGHSRIELRPERTLESLYLDPLRERVRVNGGKVFPGGPPLTLLVDIKTDGVETYEALREVLRKYGDLLTTVRSGKVETKAVTVVLSGNRPWERVAAEELRHAGVDGRLEDLAGERPSHLMPLVSDHWGRHFTWKGEGSIPAAEKLKLEDLVKKTHAQGRRLRFWATPEKPELWRELHAAGVDLINTDDLAGLAAILRKIEGGGG